MNAGGVEGRSRLALELDQPRRRGGRRALVPWSLGVLVFAVARYDRLRFDGFRSWCCAGLHVSPAATVMTWFFDPSSWRRRR